MSRKESFDAVCAVILILNANDFTKGQLPKLVKQKIKRFGFSYEYQNDGMGHSSSLDSIVAQALAQYRSLNHWSQACDL